MKIIFHDVDGCLNADGNTPIPIGGEQFSPNQSAKLKELGRKLDNSSIDQFVINTGRSIAETLPIVEGIASDKLQYVVAEHGAIYLDIVENKTIVPEGQIVERIELIRSFIDWYKNIGTNILNEKIGTNVPILEKVANLTLDARNGLDSEEIYITLQDVVRSNAPFDSNQLVFHHSAADGYVDAMGQINKSDGVNVVTSLIATKNSSTKNMLEVATIPVCPRNAEPEVRALCRSRSGVVSEYGFIDATLSLLDEYI